MRRFFQSVGAKIRTFTAILALAAIFVVEQIFQDQILAAIYWLAGRMNLTPTEIVRLALANPIAAFFGSAVVVLTIIFLLAWRDVRRQSPPSTAAQASTAESVSPTIARVTLPPVIECVDIETTATLTAYDDGYGRWTPQRGSAEFMERGIVVSFRHRSGVGAVVRTHLTFTREGGERVIINDGCWLEHEDAAIGMHRGDTALLLIATTAVRHHIRYYAVEMHSRSKTKKVLPDGQYRVEVELDIEPDGGKAESVPYVFDMAISALNPLSTIFTRA